MALIRLLLLLFFSFGFALPPASARRVSLAVYYETLCPYCSQFIAGKLSRIFSNGLISGVDLKLVPFGNAFLGPNGTIVCQHGAYECLLNAVEACAISVWPNVQEHFRFIYCIERLITQGQDNQWRSCFQKTGLDSKAVVDCYNKGYAEKLELRYAAQTNALQPPHRYVPWVLVDGQPLYDDYDNFEAYICSALDGKQPKACDGLSLTTTEKMKTNQADRVCHVN